MTPQEFKEGVAAYVLGALDPEEQKRFDEFLESGQADAECLEAYNEALETTDALNNSLPPVKPPAHVWEKIESVTVTDMPVYQEDEDGRGGVLPVLFQAVPWAIAASLLLVTFLTQSQMSQFKTRLSELEQRETLLTIELTSLRKNANYMMAVMDKPGTQLVSMDQQRDGTHRAAMLMHKGDKECMVVGTGLEDLDGKYYTLWFIDDGVPRNAGVLKIDASGTGMIDVDWDAMGHSPSHIAITIEDDGNTPKPSMDQLILMGPI